MTLELDDETLDMIHDLEFYAGDESYANHLAYKVLALYKEQTNE